MAALAVPVRSLLPARLSLPFLRPRWSLICEPSSSASTISQIHLSNGREQVESEYSSYEASSERSSAPWYLYLPGISSLLELFPPILLAVPKHKVSHSRKSMRSANKGLKNKTNFSHCPACGAVKLSHHLCAHCYSQISRRWKREARGEVVGLGGSSQPEL